MKRLIVRIGDAVVGAEEIKQADREASRRWSASHRKPSVRKARKHRALSPEEREAKAKQTAQRKREREAERASKEHDRLMKRLRFVLSRDAREAERQQNIRVAYKPGREPKFAVICPRALYRRAHAHAPAMSSRPARMASDGLRNIVLKRSCRGFGRQAEGTRAYKAGEAGRAARYIARPEGIEEVDGSVLTNVLGSAMTSERCFSIEQQQEIVGCFDALEEIERATGNGHVYSHLIMAFPYELGPEGRATALRSFCDWLDRLGVPFTAALHKPDSEGSQRNFHAHVIVGTRPCQHVDPYSWTFSAEKLTELISAPGTKWLRMRLAHSFNAGLKALGSPIRYSGVSQEDRGLVPLAANHKGQRAVAKERLAKGEEKIELGLLVNAAAHTLRLFDEIQRMRSKLRERQRDRWRSTAATLVDAGPTVHPQAPVAEEQIQHDPNASRRAGLGLVPPNNPQEKNAAAGVPSKIDNRTRIMLSLDIFGREKVTVAMERLVTELMKSPAKVALATYEGRPQVAYSDPQLGTALSAIRSSPVELAWLTRLASSLSFDHAGVPPTWFSASLHADKMFLPFRADHWAPQYGGLEVGYFPSSGWDRSGPGRG